MSPKSKVSSLKSLTLRRASIFVQRTARRTSDFRLPTLDLPFVFVNMAMTADGKIASANRALASFGSARDHAHLLQLRATADAVMAGARTVDSANINLGPGGAKFRRWRRQRGLAAYNVRVLVSGSGSINPRAEIFKHRFSPIILLTTQQTPAAKLRQLRSLADEVKICGETEINFRAALRWLRARWGIERLLCEGGGELNAALFRAGLVDELHLTVCPKIFGGQTAPTLADGSGGPRKPRALSRSDAHSLRDGLKLADAAQFKLKSAHRVADEMFLVYTRAGRVESGAG